MTDKNQIVGYVSGLAVGVTKKVTAAFTISLFTREEHANAERAIGQLYSRRPVDSIFSPEGIAKLQGMVQSKDLRGIIKIARDESAISDRPWCVVQVVSAIQAIQQTVPEALYCATTAYLISLW